MLLCANAALEENKQRINELNVFPVPDGDTGTNMSLTMNSAAIELGRKQTDTVGAVADCAASALLRGARGNSGVILSLLFRGIAKSLKGRENANAAEFAAAVSAGVDAAYKAVMKPAEGTILTVSRLGAQAAVEFAKESTDFEAMLEALLAAAREALADTQNINPVLRRAGVVDAGGEGFVLVMDAMLGYLQGRTAAPVTAAAPAAAAPKEGADFSEFDTGEITFGYCTEFIVARENSKSPELLRSFLNNLGDCVVVVDDDEIIKVHVHTNVPGEVLTEALTYGPLQTVKIENMRNQHTALSGSDAPAAPEAVAESEPAVAAPEKQFGVVAVSAGEGMADLFRELGVDRVVTGGQTMNPSTEDILTEVNKTPAEVVFVLPNNKNIIMAAQQCVGLTEKQVIVVPTATVPQGISAMMAVDPDNDDPQAILAAMTEAAANVTTAQITYAARNSDFDGFAINEGDYLALCDGKLLGTDRSLDVLLDKLAHVAADKNAEFVTVYSGQGVTEDDAARAAEVFETICPDAEVAALPGGQPVYYYIIAIE